MVWQEVFPTSVSRRDAEEERELRLAAQARAGADWAFAALVARYQPPVTRYLTRLTGNPTVARVLAERIFVRMQRRVRGPQGGLYLRLWVLRACTEAGLDAVRQPRHSRFTARLEGPRPAGLLTGQAAVAATDRLRAGLGALANLTGTTSRQMRKLIWSTPEVAGHADAASNHPSYQAEAAQTVEEMEQMEPRDALRYRMVRAVLAELPYGDAQCLALHLVAGLNQAEVAQALGITHSATRKRIVHGLQLFAQRYEAAAASLGLPTDAFAPATERAAATATLTNERDNEELFDIADQPTLDLKRPTIVTGTIAAVSPVIRTADPTEDVGAPAEATAEEGATNAAAEPPQHAYPEIAEVTAVLAPAVRAARRDKPFVVALATEPVELVINPAGPEDMSQPMAPTLLAPEAPIPEAARLVPVLTPTAPADVGQPARQESAHISAAGSSMVRMVPVLTAGAAMPGKLAAVEAALAVTTKLTTKPTTRPELPLKTRQAEVRRVPVVSPPAETFGAVEASDAVGRIPLDEDSIATTPLRGRNGQAAGDGVNANNGHGHASPSPAADAPEHEAETAPLAIAAVSTDDAGADI